MEIHYAPGYSVMINWDTAVTLEFIIFENLVSSEMFSKTPCICWESSTLLWAALLNQFLMITIALKSRKDGGPIAGQLLSLEFSKPVIGWTKPKPTDASGVATFSVQPGECTLFLNGGRYLSGPLGKNLVVFVDQPEENDGLIQADLQAETPNLDASALNLEAWL